MVPRSSTTASEKGDVPASADILLAADYQTTSTLEKSI